MLKPRSDELTKVSGLGAAATSQGFRGAGKHNAISRLLQVDGLLTAQLTQRSDSRTLGLQIPFSSLEVKCASYIVPSSLVLLL